MSAGKAGKELAPVRSMTGFGQGSGQAQGRSFTAEVRTVNHKYLDIKLRLPFGLQALEARVQTVIRRHLHRGRVDVTVGTAAGSLALVRPRVDESLAQAYVGALKELAGQLGLQGGLGVADLIRLHDILLVLEPAADLDALAPGVEAAVESALQGVDRMRAEEGTALATDLQQRMAILEQLCGQLEAQAPQTVKHLQERLTQRLGELLKGVPLEPHRLAQECALLAERADVAEELTRLASHLRHFHKLLASREPAGRKLDFLCQEFNREANTLGAKAANADMVALVVDLKAEIERIREQVQNVE